MANSCGHPAIGHDKDGVTTSNHFSWLCLQQRALVVAVKETKFCNVDVHCQKDKECFLCWRFLSWFHE